MIYTLRIQANVNGRQASAYEIDVESMELLQAMIDAAQDGMQNAIDKYDAGIRDRIEDETGQVVSSEDRGSAGGS